MRYVALLTGMSSRMLKSVHVHRTKTAGCTELLIQIDSPMQCYVGTVQRQQSAQK